MRSGPCGITLVSIPTILIRLSTDEVNDMYPTLQLLLVSTESFSLIVIFLSFSGQLKIKFIPELVGPFLEMTLIPETGKFSLLLPFLCPYSYLPFVPLVPKLPLLYSSTLHPSCLSIIPHPLYLPLFCTAVTASSFPLLTTV